MKLFNQDNAIHKPGHLRQRLHWYIMMSVMVIGVLVLLVRGITIFIQIQHDTQINNQVSEEQSRALFNTDKLTEALEYFSLKQESYEALKATPTDVADPS